MWMKAAAVWHVSLIFNLFLSSIFLFNSKDRCTNKCKWDDKTVKKTEYHHHHITTFNLLAFVVAYITKIVKLVHSLLATRHDHSDSRFLIHICGLRRRSRVENVLWNSELHSQTGSRQAWLYFPFFRKPEGNKKNHFVVSLFIPFHHLLHL